jgi:phage tail sheath gpL-like
MGLTSIGDQLTPGRPIEITFAAETGLPSSNQTLVLVGHLAASGGASGITLPYEVVTINNVVDSVAASGEANAKFGAGSELAKMVIAAVKANAGGSTFPAIKCVGLNPADTDFGAADAALTALSKTECEYIVSPYDAQNQTLTNKLKSFATTYSGAQRVENSQFGTIGVAFNRSTVDPSTLFKYDTQFLSLQWLRDTGTGGNAPALSIAEMAAAGAAVMAGNIAPFNPQDSLTIQNVDAPLDTTQNITVGAGLESETALQQGWTPWFVKPNGEVAFVRTVTTRKTVDADGVTTVTAYFDVQDFNVLYLWRKTLFTRFNQPDFKRRKASAQAAQDIKSEVIRLATAFQDQGMFQAVDQLAKQFVVQRSSSDRSRFDVFTPVNVIPGLHVIATNVQAGTQFDQLTI